jgi:hypothetical protein
MAVQRVLLDVKSSCRRAVTSSSLRSRLSRAVAFVTQSPWLHSRHRHAVCFVAQCCHPRAVIIVAQSSSSCRRRRTVVTSSLLRSVSPSRRCHCRPVADVASSCCRKRPSRAVQVAQREARLPSHTVRVTPPSRTVRVARRRAAVASSELLCRVVVIVAPSRRHVVVLLCTVAPFRITSCRRTVVAMSQRLSHRRAVMLSRRKVVAPSRLTSRVVASSCRRRRRQAVVLSRRLSRVAPSCRRRAVAPTLRRVSPSCRRRRRPVAPSCCHSVRVVPCEATRSAIRVALTDKRLPSRAF